MIDVHHWSYNLLSPSQQRLFRRLAVFEGGASLEAVESICQADEEKGRLWESLQALLEHHILESKPHQDDESLRFCLRETTREYGLECLLATGEEPALREAHAAYYLRLIEEEGQRVKSVTHLYTTRHVERESANIGQAFDWFLRIHDSERALRLWNAARKLYNTSHATMAHLALWEWGEECRQTNLEGDELDRPERAHREQHGFQRARHTGQQMTAGKILCAYEQSGLRPSSAAFSYAEHPLDQCLCTNEEAVEPLTPREQEVLRWLARGLTNAQIAEQFTISPQTVQSHMRSIYSKLGVRTRSAATRYALTHGLL